MKTILYIIIIPYLILTLSSCSEDLNHSSLSKKTNNLPYECYYTYEDGKLLNGDSASMIFIRYKLSSGENVIMTFGNKLRTPNQNFDLSDIFIYDNKDSAQFYSRDDSNRVFGHQTDNIQPVRIKAINQIDGDFANSTSTYFTGGFHGYKNDTSPEALPTMYEVSKIVTTDGKIISPGEKRQCKNIKIIVTNLLQASNTEKKNGSSRYAMEEKTEVNFLNDTAFIKTDFIPMEDIQVYQIDGLAFFNDFDNIQFIGSKSKTGTYPPNIVNRADRNVKTIRQSNDKYIFDVSIDNRYGIGNLMYNYYSYNAEIMDARKSYFCLIEVPDTDPIIFKKGQSFSFKGKYVFKLKDK
jgi:hypothetical protein